MFDLKLRKKDGLSLGLGYGDAVRDIKKRIEDIPNDKLWDFVDYHYEFVDPKEVKEALKKLIFG